VRLVFDTNVLVSVLLTPGGTSDRAFRIAVATGATLLYDARMLAEYRAVLSRAKFRAAITPRMIEQLVSGITEAGEKIDALAADLDLPDPDDLPFLEVALTGRADALVTGNARHFQPARGIVVVSPGRLLKLLAVEHD